MWLFQEFHNKNEHYIFSKAMRPKGGHVPHPILYTKFLIAEMVWNKLLTVDGYSYTGQEVVYITSCEGTLRIISVFDVMNIVKY